MDAEVGEAFRRGPRGTPGPFRNENHDPARYGMLFPIHADRARTRDAHDKHVYLVVDVLPHAPTRLETHQVGVEIRAPFEVPDRALPPGRGSGGLAEVHRTSLAHTLSTLTRTTPRVPAWRLLWGNRTDPAPSGPQPRASSPQGPAHGLREKQTDQPLKAGIWSMLTSKLGKTAQVRRLIHPYSRSAADARAG